MSETYQVYQIGILYSLLKNAQQGQGICSNGPGFCVLKILITHELEPLIWGMGMCYKTACLIRWTGSSITSRFKMSEKKIEPIKQKILDGNEFYSFRELEKVLKREGSIDSVTLKAGLKELVERGEIEMEKIGTSNYYWKFGDTTTKRLYAERKSVEALKESIRTLQTQIGDERENRNHGNRDQLLEKYGTLSQIKTSNKQKLDYAKYLQSRHKASAVSQDNATLDENISILSSTLERYTYLAANEIINMMQN